MAALIIQPVQVDLPPEIIAAVQDEVKNGGLDAGMLFIGGVTKVPDVLYLLWHLAGEVPVTAMIRRDDMANPDSARVSAQEFLSKWNQRMG